MDANGSFYDIISAPIWSNQKKKKFYGLYQSDLEIDNYLQYTVIGSLLSEWLTITFQIPKLPQLCSSENKMPLD